MSSLIFIPQRQNPAQNQMLNFMQNLILQKISQNFRTREMEAEAKMISAQRSEAAETEKSKKKSELLSRGYQIRNPIMGQLSQGQQTEGVYSDPYLGVDIKPPPNEKATGKTGMIEIVDPATGKPAIFETYVENGRLKVGNRLGSKFMPPEKSGEPIDPEKALNIATGLRKEFTSQSKVFVDVRDAYSRILSSAKDPSPAGDLAMIFNYMKVLDPGSTVREGEFATAENSGSIPQRIWQKYNKVLTGERLPDTLRKDFVKRAGMLYEGQLKSHKQLRGTYSKLSKNYGVPENNVLIDYALEPEANVKVDNKLIPAHKSQAYIDLLYKKYGLNPNDK